MNDLNSLSYLAVTSMVSFIDPFFVCSYKNRWRTCLSATVYLTLNFSLILCIVFSTRSLLEKHWAILKTNPRRCMYLKVGRKLKGKLITIVFSSLKELSFLDFSFYSLSFSLSQADFFTENKQTIQIITQWRSLLIASILVLVGVHTKTTYTYMGGFNNKKTTPF